MKKIRYIAFIVFFLTVVSLVSCSTNTTKNTQEEISVQHDTISAKAFVQELYADILGRYEEGDASVYATDKYASAGFIKLVHDLDASIECGEIPSQVYGWGCDPWIMAQDWCNDMKADIVRTELQPDGSCIIEVIILCGEEGSYWSNPVLHLVKEGGCWKVDDFSLDSRNEAGETFKEALSKDYLALQMNKPDNEMEEVRKAIVKALDAMAEMAREKNMQGVAVASVLPKTSEVDWLGEMKVVDTPYNPDGGDKGWNLVAIAWSKAGEVIATCADSGNPDRKCMIGELNFTGGAYGESQHFKFAFAFSGGLSEDDYAVAQYGIDYIKSLLEN